MLKLSWLFIFLFFISGCKTAQKSTAFRNTTALETIAVKENHIQNFSQFATLETRLKVRYEDKNQLQNLTVTLRIQKDSFIWLNVTVLGIPIARAMITPGSVRYYEKLNKTYFDGDFTLLSNLLGINLNFHQFQSLLLGESVFDLKTNEFEGEISKGMYRLQSNTVSDLFEAVLLIRPDNFKLTEQQVLQPGQSRFFRAQYLSYQTAGGQIFPGIMTWTALDNQEKTTIDVEWKDIQTNLALNLPFKIPSGYSEINLK